MVITSCLLFTTVVWSEQVRIIPDQDFNSCSKRNGEVLIIPNFMMVDEDERRKKVLNANLLLFRDNLDALELLDYLPCIHRMKREQIECEYNNNGSKHAMQMLLYYLPNKDNWFEQLVTALREPGINKSWLARILDPEGRISTTSPFTGYDKEHILKCPMREAPYTLTAALKPLDYDGNWREFAGHLGYTLENIQKYEAHPSKDGSHVTKVIKDWSSKSNATIGTLINVLHELERKDILSRFDRILGLVDAQQTTVAVRTDKELMNSIVPEEGTCLNSELIENEIENQVVKDSADGFISSNFDSGYYSYSRTETESLDSHGKGEHGNMSVITL